MCTQLQLNSYMFSYIIVSHIHMITRTRIETGFDIDDPIGCFAADGMLLYLVRNKYEGKCFRGTFIRTVDKILRQSECTIVADSNAMKGTVNIEFEATTLTYPVGWVVVGCRIDLVKPEMLVCSRDNVKACIKRVKLLDSLKVGQYIPVRVGKVTYNIGATEVTVLGTLFTPPTSPTIYQLEPSADVPYDSVLKLINEEEAMVADIDPKARETFTKLLSPYTTRPPLDAHERVLQLSNITADLPKYISRDGRLDLLQPQLIGMDTLPPDERVTERVVCIPRGDAIIRVLMDYYIMLRCRREMVALYKDGDIVNSHTNLWAIYGKSKAVIA